MVMDFSGFYLKTVNTCIATQPKVLFPHVFFIIMRSYVNWDEEISPLTSQYFLSKRDEHRYCSSKIAKPFSSKD